MIGGWEFVEAAYAIAYGALGLYGLWLGRLARRAFARPAIPESCP